MPLQTAPWRVRARTQRRQEAIFGPIALPACASRSVMMMRAGAAHHELISQCQAESKTKSLRQHTRVRPPAQGRAQLRAARHTLAGPAACRQQIWARACARSRAGAGSRRQLIALGLPRLGRLVRLASIALVRARAALERDGGAGRGHGLHRQRLLAQDTPQAAHQCSRARLRAGVKLCGVGQQG